MLVLSRRVGERIWIGDQISITVVRLTNGGVRLGIDAPPELPVVREELKLRMDAERMNFQEIEKELREMNQGDTNADSV
jgi:carbon storage regulator